MKQVTVDSTSKFTCFLLFFLYHLGLCWLSRADICYMSIEQPQKPYLQNPTAQFSGWRSPLPLWPRRPSLPSFSLSAWTTPNTVIFRTRILHVYGLDSIRILWCYSQGGEIPETYRQLPSCPGSSTRMILACKLSVKQWANKQNNSAQTYMFFTRKQHKQIAISNTSQQFK